MPLRVVECGQARRSAARDGGGIQMSVPEWYEGSVADLRQNLRSEHHARLLGQMLTERRVVNVEELAKALAEQRAEAGKPLLE